MNSPNLKRILLIVGILPTLLTGLAQIGYLSVHSAPEYTSLSQPTLFDALPKNQPLTHPKQIPDRSLIIASLLISLGGILLACCIAIYFSRRLSRPLVKRTDRQSKRATVSTISLPYSETAETPSATTPPPTAISSGPYHPTSTLAQPSQLSVLIADDNNINRLLLSNQLEGRCQKITVAKEGVEALEYLTSEHFDLILLDLQMPGHSGLELIKIIRENHCINRNTPVIAITAHAQISQRKIIIAEGFDECLIKPILTEQLDEIIDLWQPLSNPPDPDFNSDYPQQILNKTYQNKELALTIAKKLFDELPRQLKYINTALKNHHLEQALEITHKLHGSVSFCGLTHLQKPASALEQSLLSNNSTEAQMHFCELQDATLEFIESEQTTLTELSKKNEQTAP